MSKRKETRIKVKDLKCPEALVHIRGSKNNFMVTLTDLNGNALKQDSAGVSFKGGGKKSTPYAANMVSDRLARWAL